MHGEEQQVDFQPQTSYFFSRYRDRLEVLEEPFRISRKTRCSTGEAPVQIHTHLSIRAIEQEFVVVPKELIRFASFHPLRRVAPVNEETPGPHDVLLANQNVQVAKPAERQIAIKSDRECRTLKG